MKLNYSPIPTTRNYGINYFETSQTFDKQIPQAPCTIFADGSNISDKICLPKQSLSPEVESQLIAAKNNATICIQESLDSSVYVNFDLDKNDSLVHTTNFVASHGVSRNIIIKYQSNNAKFINSYLHFELENNSQINVVLFVDTKSCEVYQNIEADLKENAKFNMTIIMLDSNKYVLRNCGELSAFATNNIKCIYLGANKSQTDINIISNAVGKNSITNIDVIGALNSFATKNFKGTINFEKGSTKSFGTENELCLLLSPSAKSKALPMILCGEEDVEGSHSSATGKIQNQELFYIMSRGISKKDAIKLITKAKFNNIISTIFDEQIKTLTLNIIDRKLDDEE